jgi:hypothetical protein
MYRMADAPPNFPIPDWLAIRLCSAGGQLSPRYESPLYGPINSIRLTWYFPFTLQYMIKPQGKIRPQYSSDIVDDVDMVRISGLC